MPVKESSNRQLLKYIKKNTNDISALKIDVSKIKKNISNINIKLFEHDKRFEKLEVNTAIIPELYGMVTNLKTRVDSIDEKTAFIPKIYDIVDAIVGEIRISRQERALLTHRVYDHEE